MLIGLIWYENRELFQIENFENADFWIQRLKTIQKFPLWISKNHIQFWKTYALIELIFKKIYLLYPEHFPFFLNFNSRLDLSFLRFWTEATASLLIYFL